MAREQLQTLTEPMYYILLCMQEECCGVDIMRKVESISKGRIKVGAGTIYGLLDKFLMAEIIQETILISVRSVVGLICRERENADFLYRR